MMRIYHHRQQTPFRTDTGVPDDIYSNTNQSYTAKANGSVNMRPEETTSFSAKMHTANETPRHVQRGVKSESSASEMAIDTPAVVLAASSSSSSVSPVSTPGAVEAKTLESCSLPTQTQQQAYGSQHWSHHSQCSSHHQNTYKYTAAPISGPRGMVPASPGGPKTPPIPTRPRSGNRHRIGAPPKPYRVTSISTRSNRSRLAWSPFAADRRYSDQQLQQMEEQRQRRPNVYNPNYCYYQTLPHPYQHLPVPPEPFILPGFHCSPQVIGHPALRIYKLKLPTEYQRLLDHIVAGCEAYAKKRSTGWRTDLYSLTQQDIALMDTPNVMKIALPIMKYLTNCICQVFNASSVRVDRNQPHVLKYNKDHTGVELHHDRCDVTANLMLSRSHTYVGGGTYFPDANRVVRLKFGEFLLHPGQLVHSGHNISAGNRYLMVLFANLK